jgi:phosphatidylinositol alpha-mannosyltransferase
LFDNGNADDLAAAIGRLLDDPERRATLSAAASVAVRDYDWPKIARDVVKVYEAVLPAVLARGDTAPAGGYPRTPDGPEPPAENSAVAL